MDILEPLATALGIACVALAARRSVWTFPTGIVSVLLVGIVVWRGRLYSDALLQLFFVAANLYGWREWHGSRETSGTVIVGTMAPRARAVWFAGWLIATLAWGAAMHRFTDASYPWWDAAIAVASVGAQVMMARRWIENWWVWIAVDLASVPLYLAKQLWAFAGLYAIYLLLSLWGLWDWRRAARAPAC